MNQMTRRPSLVGATALALLLGACAQGADPIPDAESAAPVAETAADSTLVGDSDLAVGAPATSEPTVDALSGSLRISNWIPSCSIGPPWSAGPADCERVGGYSIVPVTMPGVRTGTLDGAETFFGTYAVADDGRYLLAGISSFVGTVGECGEGTIVFNTAAWGTFDSELSAEAGSPVSGPAESVSYTATASKLASIDVALEMSGSMLGPTEVGVVGTVRCSVSPESIAEVRPESAVSPTSAYDWTGATTFAQGETCIPFGPTEEACPSVDGFVVHGLANTLTFSGSHQGVARFIGTNLISADIDYEHAGIIVFEGTVEGCGEVTSINVNEAAGNGFEPGFDHTRGFTPAGFDPGPMGVFVDGGASQTGVVSGGLVGSYSC